MTTENLDIRILVSELKLTFKDIAERMTVSPEYLSRCMRHPLKPEMRERVMKAITDLRGDPDDV